MSDSDVESDEDFTKTLSYFGDVLMNCHGNRPQRVCWLSERKGTVLELLTTQIASGRIDRVESILLLLMRFHKTNSLSQTLVDELVFHALSQAASRGNVGAIRMIGRITAGYGFSIAKEHAAIRMLIFQNENPSCVEALQELGFDEGASQAFDMVKEGRTRELFGRCGSIPQSCTVLRWKFFLAALGGDLEEVKRILDDPQTDLDHDLDVNIHQKYRGWPPSSCAVRVCSPPLCAAAARGHWKVVKAILEKSESLKTTCRWSPIGPPARLEWVFWNNLLYRVVVIIAAQRNDFSIFSEKFPELENAISDVPFLSDLFREAQPEFVDIVMALCKLRLQHKRVRGVHNSSLQKLKDLFMREVRCHSRPCHLNFLMQEIFAQMSVSVKVLAPFLLNLLLVTKRVSVVKQVLLFKPRFFIDNAFLDLEDYTFDRCSESLWARGVRLLVEAGVTANSPVPAEHTELFSLSLQDRCLTIVRVCLKLPVHESVSKLPIPPSLKRRLLYRF